MVSQQTVQREFILGIVEDLPLSKLRPSSNSIRTSVSDIGLLAQSISEKGLLQPLVVRIKDDHYEIVAGNRRYLACKHCGWKKIPCNVCELDDKEAFEISLIENIQRKSMNPIEEAKAYNLYVKERGWGGVSDLAHQIGKSQEYVSKRIKLLDLPEEIQEQIIRRRIKSSLAEELCYVKNKRDQSTLARLISRRHLTVKRFREVVISSDDRDYPTRIISSPSKMTSNQSLAAFDRAIVSLKLTLNRLTEIMENVENDWHVHETLLQHRQMVHNQIDSLLRNRKKYSKLKDIS
jgi:ParB family transcriptional regulator, chromosome partitioning protein